MSTRWSSSTASDDQPQPQEPGQQIMPDSEKESKDEREMYQSLTTVNAYIHEAQQEFSWRSNAFYTIPKEVNHLCLSYFHDTFPKMMRDVFSNDVDAQLVAVCGFCKLLSTTKETTPINQLIDSGVVPRLFHSVIILIIYNYNIDHYGH